jgi:hypothetical protein
MTSDEKEAAVLDFMKRVAGAVEKVASAIELQCRAVAAKNEVDVAARTKALALFESLLPSILSKTGLGEPRGQEKDGPS